MGTNNSGTSVPGNPLKDQSAFLAASVQYAPVGVAIWDTDLRFVYINDALAAVNGRSPSEHIGSSLYDVIPDVAPVIEPILRKVLDSGEPMMEVDVAGVSPGTGKHTSFRSTYYPVNLDNQIAGVAVVAVDVTRRVAADEARQARHANAAERSALLQDATAALGRAVGVNAVADVVLEQAQRLLGATRGLVSIIDAEAGVLRLLRAVGYSDELVDQWRELPLTDERPIVEAVRTGNTVFIPSPEELIARYPMLNDELASTPPQQSWAVVPLVVSGRIIGALRVTIPATGNFRDDQEVFLTALAGQAAHALERARLFEREHAIANSLQRSLLPPSLPNLEGVELAARYRPSGEGLVVGGDFYDVFALGDDRWGFLIGDVAGTGPDAASMTALVRYTTKAAAMLGLSPVEVLRAANRALIDMIDDDRFCTVIYGEMTRDGEKLALRYVNAGHPGPHVVCNGAAESVGAMGSLLGVLDDPELTECEWRLAPGESFLLVTDGVIEARSDAAETAEFFGEGPYEELLAAIDASSAENLAQSVESAVVRFAGTRASSDDMAILAIRASD